MNTNIKGKIGEEIAVELLPNSKLNPIKSSMYRNYDIDWCGKKVEVKMSTTYPVWNFHVNYPIVVDYYLWIGFKNNRPYRSFFIPIKELKGRSYRISADPEKRGKQSRFRKYEIKIFKNLQKIFKGMGVKKP